MRCICRSIRAGGGEGDGSRLANTHWCEIIGRPVKVELAAVAVVPYRGYVAGGKLVLSDDVADLSK